VITRPTNPRSPSSRPGGELRHGVVKRFDEGTGLGIITQEDGTQIAVHHSGIVGAGRKSLRSGQRVRYRIGTGLKGPEARDVQVE